MFSLQSCWLFQSEGRVILQQGNYVIREKKLFSYYQASPDLIVTTDSGTAKINLNGFGKIVIPQEKIDSAAIQETGKDTLAIYLYQRDTSGMIEEVIFVPIRYAVDSILHHNQQ